MNSVNLIEEWRDIEGYEGYYQISNKGRVKSLPRKRMNGKGSYYMTKTRILKHSMTTTGYKKVELTKNGKRKSKRIHRLIAKAFIPKVEGKPDINHIDGNPLNNEIQNLEWCTQRENVLHALEIGLRKTINIPKNKLRELYVEQGLSLREVGEELGMSAPWVSEKLRREGIKVRNISEAKDEYKLTNEIIINGLKTNTQKELANKIGCDQSLISYYYSKIKKGEVIQ